MKIKLHSDTLHFTKEEMPESIKEPYITLGCLALSLITATLFYSFN
jgi:hypothetical protein